MSNSVLLEDSKEIFAKGFKDFKPDAVVLMLSGGDDSLTCLHVAIELGIKIDFVIHGNTRTGIQETTEFARKETAKAGLNYLEADAGDSYLKYLKRKGFFGVGISSHAISYHLLKQDHFERIVSAHLRKRQRNFRIISINGGRRDESENRMKRFISPYRITPRRKNDMWVNLINNWSKKDCKDYLSGNSIQRNEVSVNLCRSGECMCGTMQSRGDRAEASYFYPDWGKNLDALEKEIRALHGFGWGEQKPKPDNPAQINMFQPMCVGCMKGAEELGDGQNHLTP